LQNYIYGLETPLTIIISIIGFIIVIFAQTKVSKSYSKFKKESNKKGITGVEAAQLILSKNGLDNIYVVETNGELTDHYDPSRNVIRLSKDIFHGESIASLAVASHEVGHALQNKDGYSFMKIRSFLAPVVNFVTSAGYIVLILSLVFGALAYVKIGIFIILGTLLFQLVTLPVEFNASKRAQEQLLSLKLIDKKEETSVKEMLSAAAFTYVASVIGSILSLLRLIIMTQNRD